MRDYQKFLLVGLLLIATEFLGCSNPQTSTRAPANQEPPPNSEIKPFLVSKTSFCEDLLPGQSLAVLDRKHDFTNGIRYLLTRIDENHYQAGIEFGFRLKRSLLDRIFKRSQNDTSREEIQSLKSIVEDCYKNAVRLKTEDGKFLQLRLLSAEDVISHGLSEEDLLQKVKVSKLKERADSRNWQSDGDSCRTIIHESLHLLGLVDQYAETQMGAKKTKNGALYKVSKGADYPYYDCRTLGPQSSIMSNSQYWGSPVPKVIEKTCFCDVGTTEDQKKEKVCSEALKKFENFSDACPPPSKQLISFKEESPDKSMGVMPYWPQKGATGRWRIAYALMSDYPEFEPSPLMSADLRAIVYPGCELRNPIYYSCIANAYRSSRSLRGCIPQKDLPKECSDKDFSWLR